MSLPDFKTMYRELIARPSISALDQTLNQSNRAVIELLAQWCEQLGFSIEITELHSAPGKFNLLARKCPPGLTDQAGGLMLAGHTDTVPFDDSRWNFDPFTLSEQDNRLYGLGSIDMKGFFSFALKALEDLQAIPQSAPIMILATADEEITMAGAQEVARHSNLKPTRCIIGEPTDMVPVYTHKGHMSSAIRVTGRSGHSSDPDRGLNAIEIMQQVMTNLLQLKEDLKNKYSLEDFAIPYPTLNLGHIHGATTPTEFVAAVSCILTCAPCPDSASQSSRPCYFKP